MIWNKKYNLFSKPKFEHKNFLFLKDITYTSIDIIVHKFYQVPVISEVKLNLKFLYTSIQPFFHHKCLLLSCNSRHLYSIINNIQACIENIYRLQSMYTKKKNKMMDNN